MCGVDIDVPDRYWKKPPNEPSFGSGVAPARIFTPGAVMSGLIQSGTVGNGPRDEKPAITLPFISFNDEGARSQRRIDRCAAVIAAWIASPGALSIMTAGMLSDSGVACRPSRSWGCALVYIRTAIAPALAALVSLTEKSQVPRAIRPIRPRASPPAMGCRRRSGLRDQVVGDRARFLQRLRNCALERRVGSRHRSGRVDLRRLVLKAAVERRGGDRRHPRLARSGRFRARTFVSGRARRRKCPRPSASRNAKSCGSVNE